MNLLVVGAGRMGRWVGTATADAVDDLAFADVDPAVARAAAEAVGGRAVEAPPEESFDAVCLAVPIPAVADAVERYAPVAEGAMLDVTGVMADPVAAMAEHAPDLERVSLHPLFAPPREPGNVAVVPAEPGPLTDEVRAALAGRGNDCFEVTATEHDRAMATVQGAAHAALLAYGVAADDVREEFHTPVSAGLADLLETVTDGDARVYADVQAAFDGAGAIASAAARFAQADREEFASLYGAAGEHVGPTARGETVTRSDEGESDTRSDEGEADG